MNPNDAQKIGSTLLKVSSTDTTNEENFTEVERQMRSRFQLLPADIQEVIISDNYSTKLFEIAKARKLTYEQLGSLEIETSMMLLGMTKPDEFRDELMLQLKLSDEMIDGIVKDLGDQIFLPIRESIQKVYTAKDNFENRSLPEDAPIAPPIAQSTSDTLKNAGVEIVNDTVNPPFKAPTAPTISQPAPTINLAGTSSMNRDDLLKSIENPPAGTSSKFPSSIPTIQKIVPPPAAPQDPNIKSPITNTPNTVPVAPVSVSEQKFVAPMNMPKHETDYSIKPATPAPSTTPPRVDPYREIPQ